MSASKIKFYKRSNERCQVKKKDIRSFFDVEGLQSIIDVIGGCWYRAIGVGGGNCV